MARQHTCGEPGHQAACASQEALLANEHKFTSTPAWPRGQRERLWLFSRMPRGCGFRCRHEPNHDHLPSNPPAVERRGVFSPPSEEQNTQNTCAFCGCFIAGPLSHKCHTNLNRSRIMSEQAAEVHKRQLFPQCRTVCPRGCRV